MSTKRKTILRVKRKFSDLPAVDTIVLSQTAKPKKQKTVPWNELCQSFDKNFTIKKNNTNNKNDCTEKKVDINIDFDFNNKPKSKKQVFRLISNEKEISRHFQQNTFNEKYSNNRKSKILQQRRSNRQNYFEKIKKEITNTNSNENNKNNILQHDDFSDNTNTINTKAKPTNKNKNIKLIQNKLLKKQKLNRTTKIVSKKQIREHQKELKLKSESNNKSNNKSVFCDDWNNNNLITLNHNGERINMKNFLNKYDCFKGYKPKNIQCAEQGQKGINIIDVEFDECKQKYVKVKNNEINIENEYDCYELDEEADANEVIMAIQMRMKEKEKEKQINEISKQMNDNNNGNGNDNKSKLDLEWKLENIKNKYLTEIEIERNNYTQCYHERSINIDVNNYESENAEEIERDNELHADNQYPDEHEFSDDECGYNIYDDYFPRYNDEYNTVETGDPVDNYDENAFDVGFFKNYDFN